MCGRQAPTAFTCAPGESQSRLERPARPDCVTVQITSAPRTASSLESTALASGHSAASFSALSRVRAEMRICSNGRAWSIAVRCGPAWWPAPTIARTRASSRASARVATPDTAAVRIAVIGLAFMVASTCAGLAVEERDRALVRVEAARGVLGEDATVFSAYRGRPRRGTSASGRGSCDSPGGLTTGRSGRWNSPRASEASADSIAAMQPGMSSSSTTSCSLRISMGRASLLRRAAPARAPDRAPRAPGRGAPGAAAR